MQLTECSILLLDNPRLIAVEENFDHEYGVAPMVQRILFNLGVLDWALKLHLEEMRPAKVTHVFRTGFDVFKEYLSWEKWVTELTLRGHGTFKALSIHLHFGHFSCKFGIFIFLTRNCLRQHLVYLLYFFILLFYFGQLLILISTRRFLCRWVWLLLLKCHH